MKFEQSPPYTCYVVLKSDSLGLFDTTEIEVVTDYFFRTVEASSLPACLFHPWKREKSPEFRASRSPGVLRSQSGRISLVTMRRSCQRSITDGRPQNHYRLIRARVPRQSIRGSGKNLPGLVVNKECPMCGSFEITPLLKVQLAARSCASFDPVVNSSLNPDDSVNLGAMRITSETY